MKIEHLVLFITILSISIQETAYSQEIAPPHVPRKTGEYVSRRGNFAIQFPPGWEVEKGYIGVDVMGYSPADSAEDPFRENVNVLFSELDVPFTREEFLEKNMTGLEQLLTDFKLESSGSAVLGDLIGSWLVYTHRVGDFQVKVLQYLILADNHAYIITCSAYPDDFSKYQQTFQTIAQSFRLKR